MPPAPRTWGAGKECGVSGNAWAGERSPSGSPCPQCRWKEVPPARPHRPAFHLLAQALRAGSVPEPSPGTPSASVRPPTLGRPSVGGTEGGHSLGIGCSAPGREADTAVGRPPGHLLRAAGWSVGTRTSEWKPGTAFCAGLATQGERCFVSCHRLKSGTLAPGRGAGGFIQGSGQQTPDLEARLRWGPATHRGR